LCIYENPFFQRSCLKEVEECIEKVKWTKFPQVKRLVKNFTLRNRGVCVRVKVASRTYNFRQIQLY
jgi:hypothetical protein